ncbi:ABC transporter ATP-binding protein [Allorhizocola rhizosphaerae]|uniref:ABC transporter ATP-binding protein n=1 Tax=Allorhizocola rhizosphaerae TaxID=1872709 RepID=UPI001FE7B3F7|nr:ABC transporter ATP-binding protein [Allorhizocola rhizosphaerae]
MTIAGLTVTYGDLPAVKDVSLRLEDGTITGLVGESGSGKSTLALSLLGHGNIASGSVFIDGVGDMSKMDKGALRAVRGAKIGYVFQAAQNSLNPLLTVGKQLLDLAKSHGVRDVRGAHPLLRRMGLDPDRVLNSYQHELSGGMRQRVGIMFALVLNAHVLVLDEPTTALDMITQANILQIVREVHADRGLTTLIVTHDVGVVAEVASRVAVMYGGRIVECGSTKEVLANPRHPYTRGLINAIPRLTGPVDVAKPLPGTPPTLGTIPAVGCVFRARCPIRMDVCSAQEPEMIDDVACHAVGVTAK